jgi:hypothetical protein
MKSDRSIRKCSEFMGERGQQIRMQAQRSTRETIKHASGATSLGYEKMSENITMKFNTYA